MLTPEQQACEAAGRKLYDMLNELGVRLAGVGVGQDEDGRSAILIYLRTKAAITTQFEGYTVITVVTGDIVAL